MIRKLHAQISPDTRLGLSVAGRGPAILLLHGIGGHSGQWDAQTRALSSQCASLAWTARGYGGSTGPKVRTMGDFADDLLRVLDFLKLDRVLAVGHSMGGRILIELSATMPDRIAGIVLSGTQSAYLAHMSPSEAAAYVACRRAMFEGDSVGNVSARSLAESVMAPDAAPETVARLTRDFTILKREGYLAAIAASIGWNRDAVLSELTMPVMVMGGALDAICPPQECHRIAERVGQGPAVILDGVGHMAQFEQPDRVTELLSEFARRHGVLASSIDTMDIP